MLISSAIEDTEERMTFEVREFSLLRQVRSDSCPFLTIVVHPFAKLLCQDVSQPLGLRNLQCMVPMLI